MAIFEYEVKTFESQAVCATFPVFEQWFFNLFPWVIVLLLHNSFAEAKPRYRYTEGGTLQNPPIETQHAPEEQPTSRGSRGKSPKIRIKYSRLQESTSTVINNGVLDTVQENPSSNEEPAADNPILSKLNPPSRSGQFKTEEAYLKLRQQASSVLIEEVKKAQDANRMADLASNTFSFLDSIAIDYLALYKGWFALLSVYSVKRKISTIKNHVMLILQKLSTSKLCSVYLIAKKQSLKLTAWSKDSADVSASEMSKLVIAEEEVKKIKETLAKCEATHDTFRAQQIVSDKVYTEFESKAKIIALKMAETQVLLDDWERCWNETNDRLNRAMDESSRFKM